jgi:hypothetical protein
MTTLNTLLDNLTIQETSFRDQEPHNNPLLQKILKDLGIVETFLKVSHNPETNKKFVITWVETFNIHLNTVLFHNQTYTSYPQEFLNEMINIQKGISFFIDWLNIDNLDYNLSFIKDMSKKLREFIYYHYYVSGCLV